MESEVDIPAWAASGADGRGSAKDARFEPWTEMWGAPMTKPLPDEQAGARVDEIKAALKVLQETDAVNRRAARDLGSAAAGGDDVTPRLAWDPSPIRRHLNGLTSIRPRSSLDPPGESRHRSASRQPPSAP